ncbi:TadA family conjugal transfer-associated ATPase [Glutamicibacter sp. JC586]|uniref:TadA family conjugal transfer-associated ATPase n=1 Tax=Glutamicibacter sp. JC586 TaxID=2590552 RepID=UPI0013597FB7|nr:TadA family conjugal transfer-associated ATPase [Glutamicibacter sp. JC586]
MSSGRHSKDGTTVIAGQTLDVKILESVRERALLSGGELDAIALAGAVHDSGAALGAQGAAHSLEILQHEVAGLSILEPFARIPDVTDVLVDGQGQVWTDSPRGLELTDFKFSSPERVRELAVHLATLAGRRLDSASPFMDMSLKNYRVHAVLPPIAVAGPLISIRVKHGSALGLSEVLQHSLGFWDSLLRTIINEQMNFLITGGTGSGKTTLLQSMLSVAGGQQRLVIVEDSQELQVNHPHVVSLQTRAANVEAAGLVELKDLVVQALRMRPDRLIVGECRGEEIRDFLAAMNTGHQGAAGTLHANNPESVPARLAALGALAGWSVQATSLQASSALDLVIHLSRGDQGRRGPVALGTLETDQSGRMIMHTLIDLHSADPFTKHAQEVMEKKFGPEIISQIVAELGNSTDRNQAPC